MERFKPGDRVRRVGGNFNKVKHGEIYVVAATEGMVTITLKGQPGYFSAGNFELAKLPTQEEINNALATLKAAGSVDFKPAVPPFFPTTIEGVGAYTAVVTNNGVTVGCTTIPLSKAMEIARAVKEATDYNIKYAYSA
jgi:hypothetical protein